MLSVRLLAIGKAKGSWAKDAGDHYAKLLKRHCRLQIVEFPEVKASPDGSVAAIRKAETERLFDRAKSDRIFAFDRCGSARSSEEYADLLSRTMTGGAGSLDLIIGGSYGLWPAALEKADEVLSLSYLTLSHQVARVVVLEQLYRAFSIFAGSAYHK
ncbi:MAG: 23S rRNA (pseudouridine(1915)-N(3))-methyltransferase RlmH [Candidatus Zixiibacteriota bacterium]